MTMISKTLWPTLTLSSKQVMKKEKGMMTMRKKIIVRGWMMKKEETKTWTGCQPTPT